MIMLRNAIWISAVFWVLIAAAIGLARAAYATCSASGAPTNTLCGGSALSDPTTNPGGIFLNSADGSHRARLAHDGQLLIQNLNTLVYTWNSGQTYAGGQAKLAVNGCFFVQLKSDGTQVWSDSPGAGTQAELADEQTCEQQYLYYNPPNSPLTPATLVMQNNGDLVAFYCDGTTVLWHTNTAGQ